jgi:hypothetical protein
MFKTLVRPLMSAMVKARVFILSAYQVGFPIFQILVTLDDHHEFVAATGFQTSGVSPPAAIGFELATLVGMVFETTASRALDRANVDVIISAGGLAGFGAHAGCSTMPGGN